MRSEHPTAGLAMARRVIVVGAGAGGLAAGALLARQGCEVTLLERGDAPGGKLHQVRAGGLPIDAGPTVFTMRWVFDALFAACGSATEDWLALEPASILARHAWNAGERLDLHADVAASEQAIGEFAGAVSARQFRRFSERARRLYETLREPFLLGERPTPISLTRACGFAGLPALLDVSPFSTLWKQLAQAFDDPRLRQLFGRYATYCGSSPFRAPATLMLVAHVESEGVWLVQGGMQRIAEALAALAARHGATLRCGCHVERILVRQGRAAGVQLEDGSTLEADAVVFNGDAAALAGGLLGREAARAVPRRPPDERSLSALTWCFTARAGGFPLHRHTVFFGADYAGEFEDVLDRHRLPRDPTVYVCAQDRGAGPHAPPPGRERLMCLVNAPAHDDTRPLPAEEIAACERTMHARLARCGLELGERSDPVTTTPAAFARRFPGTGGALYGPASHGWRASFQRPGSRCALPGLYLAGGSVHPGPGVPMALLSGRTAAQSLLADLPRSTSRSRSPRAAMPGGTSMR